MKSRAGGRPASSRAPSSLTTRATASNSTEGPPSIFSSASSQSPSLVRTPPMDGAT